MIIKAPKHSIYPGGRNRLFGKGQAYVLGTGQKIAKGGTKPTLGSVSLVLRIFGPPRIGGTRSSSQKRLLD